MEDLFYESGAIRMLQWRKYSFLWGILKVGLWGGIRTTPTLLIMLSKAEENMM